MVEPIVKQIKMYLDEVYTYFGVAGIYESPNCSITGQIGVLMQEYFALCRKGEIVEKFFEVPTWYSSDSVGNFEKIINDYIEKQNE